MVVNAKIMYLVSQHYCQQRERTMMTIKDNGWGKKILVKYLVAGYVTVLVSWSLVVPYRSYRCLECSILSLWILGEQTTNKTKTTFSYQPPKGVRVEKILCKESQPDRIG